MKIPHMRWVVGALLFLATAINYADRLALSVISTDLRREFGMSETDYAQVVAVFLIAYALMYGCSGYIVDRLGTRRGFAAFLCVWSSAAMLHGFARGKWSLAACRALLGIGEPGNWPAAARAVAEWYPPRLRALGIGIFNAGTMLGSAAAPPVVSFLTLRYGWRYAFYFTGAMGFAWLAAWLILYQPPHANRWLRAEEYAVMKNEVQRPEETVPATAGRTSWWAVMKTRECYTLTLARFFTDPVIYFVIFWLPEYLRRERHFDLAMVGKYASIPFVAGGIAYLAGGWLSGRLMHAGWRLPRARKAVILLGAALMPVAILAPILPSAALALAAVCFMTMGHAFWISNLQALPTDLCRANEIGTVMGISGMGGTLGGVLANYGTAWVVQHFTYAPVFVMAGFMHPLGFVIVNRLLPNWRFGERVGVEY